MTPDEGGRKKPCVQGMQLMCFSKTWDCNAFIQLVDKEMVLPGGGQDRGAQDAEVNGLGGGTELYH